MNEKKGKYWESLVAEKQIYGQDDMVVLHTGDWLLIQSVHRVTENKALERAALDKTLSPLRMHQGP